MEASLKLGNGNWGVKNDSLLAYDDVGGKFRPLPFDFTRASSATVVNKQGLIETVGGGIPRIDFSDDVNGALLLEPQSTNLVTYSEDFSNASWNKLNIGTGTVAVTSNQGVAPNGYLTADRIQFNLNGGVSASDRSIIRFNNSDASNRILTFYLKSFNGIDQQISLHNGAEGVPFTVTGDWQRFDFVIPSGFNFQGLGLLGSRGTDSSDLLVWGVQLEQGSYATSYIPTQGAISTRLAESCSQTPPSGVIGQTEGTVFLDSKMALQSINNYQLFSINNASGVDRIRVLTATAGRLRFIYQLNSGVSYSFYNPTDYSDLTSLKIAFTYKSGDIKVYINGVLVDSSTNTLTIAQTLTNIDIATSAGGYNQMLFNDVQLYNTALTDAELISLTTI